MLDALRIAQQPASSRFEHLLLDDAQELDLAAVRLARAVGGSALTAAGDPRRAAALPRRGAARMRSFEGPAMCTVVKLERSAAMPANAWAGGGGGVGAGRRLAGAAPGGEVEFWRCANDAPRPSRWRPTSSA